VTQTKKQNTINTVTKLLMVLEVLAEAEVMPE
jgi:hypothetical protein